MKVYGTFTPNVWGLGFTFRHGLLELALVCTRVLFSYTKEADEFLTDMQNKDNMKELLSILKELNAELTVERVDESTS